VLKESLDFKVIKEFKVPLVLKALKVLLYQVLKA
jgi:hypothetical protein